MSSYLSGSAETSAGRRKLSHGGTAILDEDSNALEQDGVIVTSTAG